MSPSSPPAPPQPMRAQRAIRRVRFAKGVEYGLWLFALLLLGYLAWVWIDARLQQAEGAKELEERPVEEIVPKRGVRSLPAYGSAVARLEIPRLGLSTIVFEGTGSDVLLRGAGRMRGSALPGEKGNVVFAAHRDTFFRPLQDLRKGDEITVDTGNGARRYVVSSTQIVNPDATEVLSATPNATLTLVTCYPFRFVGSAPQRFIAKAREVNDNEVLGSEWKARAGRLPVAASISQAPVSYKKSPTKRRLRPFSTLAVPNAERTPAPEPAPVEPEPHAMNNADSDAPAPQAAFTERQAAPAPQATPERQRWTSRFIGGVKRIARRPSKSE